MNKTNCAWIRRIIAILAVAAILPAYTCGGSVGPLVPASPGGSRSVDADWSRLGNAGTVDGTNFVGTIDNVGFDVRVNNVRALRLEPNAFSPNVIGGSGWNAVKAAAVGATIAGGGMLAYENFATDNFCTVGGGAWNMAGNNNAIPDDARYATVAGGLQNSAIGVGATVGGGQQNRATGFDATVPGGAINAASGNYSFAAGYKALAAGDGSFVWNDSANLGGLTTSAAGQFVALASGGVYFFSNAAATTGVALPAGGGAWATISDRNSKANFARVNGRETLEKVAAMPIETWNYKSQDAKIRHIGPMAQDFYAAFQVGEDEKRITTVDADGVAFAAIQGLYEIVKEENKALKGKVASLEARLAVIEKALGNR